MKFPKDNSIQQKKKESCETKNILMMRIFFDHTYILFQGGTTHPKAFFFFFINNKKKSDSFPHQGLKKNIFSLHIEMKIFLST